MPFGRNVIPRVLHRHPGHGAIIRSFSDGQHTAGSADLRGSVGATCGSSRQGFVRPGSARSSRCFRRRSPTCMAHGTRRSTISLYFAGNRRSHRCAHPGDLRQLDPGVPLGRCHRCSCRDRHYDRAGASTCSVDSEKIEELSTERGGPLNHNRLVPALSRAPDSAMKARPTCGNRFSDLGLPTAGA